MHYGIASKCMLTSTSFVKLIFKVTADRKGDNSPMRGRSRTDRFQIIRGFDTKINIFI